MVSTTQGRPAIIPSPWAANGSSLGSATSLNVDRLKEDVWFSPPSDSDPITSAVRYFDDPSAIPIPPSSHQLFCSSRGDVHLESFLTTPTIEPGEGPQNAHHRRGQRLRPALTINPTRLSRSQYLPLDERPRMNRDTPILSSISEGQRIDAWPHGKRGFVPHDAET